MTLTSLMPIIEFIKLIGGVAGAITAVCAVWALIIKKPKAWLSNVVKDSVKDDFSEIKDKLAKNDESTVCVLRHSITEIYEEYKRKKVLPSTMKQNLCALYKSYSELGGNSYVKEIYSEMMTWEVE